MPPPPARRVAVVIWAALVGGVILFSGMMLLVPMGAAMGPEMASALLLVTLAVAVPSVALSFWIPRRMRPGGAAATSDQLALSRTVVASALCEGPALFAVIALMLTRDGALLLPWAISLAALLAHFPGAARWKRLGADGGSPRGPGAPGGPARMVRE